MTTMILQSPDHFSLPIEVHIGLPFITGTINGRTGKFLFDSGGQETLLNSRYVSQKETDHAGNLRSVTGGSPSFYTPVHQMEFGEFKWSADQVLAVDMEHLEVEQGFEVLGLVGFRQIIHFDWMVDYGENRVHFWRRAERKRFSVLEQIKVKYYHHLPVVPLEIAGYQFHFLLDTGCEELLLDERHRDKVGGEVFDLKTEKVASGSPITQKMDRGTISGFRIGQQSVGASKFMVTDLSRMRKDMGEFDGIVGHALLSRFRTVVSWNFWRLWLLEPGSPIEY